MAAKVGRIMAVLFVATGVVIPAPQLLLVGVFVWIGAGSEASSVTLRALLKNVAVRAAMLTDFKTVSPFDTLSETATLVLAGSQKDFPVTNQGHLLGVLTHSNLIGALQSRGGETLVSESMDREFMTASPGEPLEAVLARCSPGNPSGLAVPVLDGERLVGLLTPEHVSELLMIRQALASHISNSQPR
jgi:CBS domain-containing protein